MVAIVLVPVVSPEKAGVPQTVDVSVKVVVFMVTHWPAAHVVPVENMGICPIVPFML